MQSPWGPSHHPHLWLPPQMLRNAASQTPVRLHPLTSLAAAPETNKQQVGGKAGHSLVIVLLVLIHAVQISWETPRHWSSTFTSSVCPIPCSLPHAPLPSLKWPTVFPWPSQWMFPSLHLFSHHADTQHYWSLYSYWKYFHPCLSCLPF